MESLSNEQAKYAYVKAYNNIGKILDTGKENNGIKWYRTDSDGVREAHELIFLKNVGEFAECVINTNAYFPPSAIIAAKEYLNQEINKARETHRNKYKEQDISLPYRDGERESKEYTALLFSALNTINRTAKKYNQTHTPAKH